MAQSTSFNDKTYDTVVSNPEPEPVFIRKEGNTNFIKALICIIVDLILTIFLIFVQYGLFEVFEDKIQTKTLVIVGTIAFVFFICIIIFLISHITILVTITRYIYIIVGSIYYAYRLILVIIYLIENEKGISNLALIFFIIILASIVPRVFGYFNIEILEKVCKRVDENRRILAHEKFIEKLGNKIDVGNSRWSNTFEIERASSVNKLNQPDENNNQQ